MTNITARDNANFAALETIDSVEGITTLPFIEEAWIRYYGSSMTPR